MAALFKRLAEIAVGLLALTISGFTFWACYDILVHPRDRDLLVATHGRSLYVFDDVRPLEELSAEVRAKDAYLFAPRPALADVRIEAGRA